MSSSNPRRDAVGIAAAPASTVGPDFKSYLPPNAYANAFVHIKPKDGAHLVQNRLHKARILTEELAEYFAARRELETAYLKALQKISKRSFLSDPSFVGLGFAEVYQRLVLEIGEVASIHGELEKKIGEECEVTMRNAPIRGEWSRQKERDDGLSSTLKDIQLLEAQLAKDQKKVEGASAKKAGSAHAKVIETQRSLDQTLQLWQTEAPFAFESYQKIDVQRLELMKETVTRFETIQSDAAQRLLDVTARTLEAVLAFDPQSDMQEFILKNGTGVADLASTANSRRPSGVVPQRSNSIASSLRPGTGNRGQNGAEFGVNPSSSSIHSTDQQQRTATSRASGATVTLKSALGRFGRGKSSKGDGDTTTMYGSLPGDVSGSSAVRASTDTARGNAGPLGATVADEQATSSSRLGGDEQPLANKVRGRGGSAGGLMQPMIPMRAGTTATPSVAPQIPVLVPAAAPQVDEEGFSIPPPDRADHKPWESIVGSGAAITGGKPFADKQREDLDDSSSVPSMSRVANLNISNATLGISQSSQDQAALERVRSTLLTATPARRGTTRRDRREVRNTTYNPMAGLDASSVSQLGTMALQATGDSAFGGASASSPASLFSGTPGVGAGRTQSIFSISSGRAAAANPFEGSMEIPGLRASILETVNAILTPSGVARLMVIGEISVSLKDVSSSTPLHLRLDSFEQLEKAAPNPTLLQPVASTPGEYTLDVGALFRQQIGAYGARATVLKYQVHVPQDKISQYVPLNVDARWRFEPQQTSFLLNYAVNGECILTQSSVFGGASIEDLSFVAPVGPTSVSSVMSKPEGQWDEEQKRLYWKLPESLPLSAAGSGGKLLGRFQVQGEGSAQPVQVRWRVPGQTMSQLGVSVLGGAEGLVLEKVARQTISGKYFAQSR